MKRYVILLLVFLLTAGSLSAQFPQKPGDPVDYSRIKRPRLQHYPLYYIGNGGDRPFTMDDAKKALQIMRNYKAIQKANKEREAKDIRAAVGQMTFDDLRSISKWEAQKRIQLVFNGELLRTRDHTAEDLENAIQSALKSMSWSREDVRVAHELANKVRTANFSPTQFWKQLEAAIGVTNTAAGVQNAIVNIVGQTSNTSAEQYELQRYVPTLDLMERTNITYPSSTTVKNTSDFVMSMENADARQKQIMKDRVTEVYENKLAQFYQLINTNLPTQRGEIWMIKLYGSVIADFTFEETLCRQVWDIRMELKDGHEDYWKAADPKAYIDGYEGIYMGSLDAHLIFYFNNYDDSFTPTTEDQVWTAITKFDMRGIGLHWKLLHEKYGGNFSHTGHGTYASADHHLPIVIELKKAKRDAKIITAKPKIIEEPLLTKRVPGLPVQRSTSVFKTDHEYSYSVSQDGFTYEGETSIRSENDSTVIAKFRQDLKTPKGENVLEEATLLMFRAIMYAKGTETIRSNHRFLKETYPIGTVEIDLQTDATR